MKTNVAIIDVKCCNLGSFVQALDFIGLKTEIISNLRDFYNSECDAVCIPGSGNSSQLMSCLEDMGFAELLRNLSIQGFPIVGVCSGMHALFEGTEESHQNKTKDFRKTSGIGIFSGTVRKIFNGSLGVNLGWRSPFSDGHVNCLKNGSHYPDSLFYFMHGFGILYNHAVHETVDTSEIQSSDVNQKIIAMIRTQNTIGIQFHPERSGQAGLTLLRDLFEDFNG